MVKICIIGVYFGEFPSYFDLWIKSAEYNRTIDFFVVTDQKLDNIPLNIKVLPMTLQKMQRLASEKLGFEVKLIRPYKCCDLKPAYGVIFSDYINNYDYWGHCDFDLIWGDIRYFTEKYEIEKYDKFLPLGHLSLFRNSDSGNNLFSLSGSGCGDYRNVFTDENNHAFDELGGICKICKTNNISFFEERIFADISKIYKRFRLALSDINYDNQVFLWEEGKIKRIYIIDDTLKNDEFMYIHFKERPDMIENDDCVSTNSFFITPSGFYSNNSNSISLNDIQKYNPFVNSEYERKELKYFEAREKKSQLKSKCLKILGKSNIR